MGESVTLCMKNNFGVSDIIIKKIITCLEMTVNTLIQCQINYMQKGLICKDMKVAKNYRYMA